MRSVIIITLLGIVAAGAGTWAYLRIDSTDALIQNLSDRVSVETDTITAKVEFAKDRFAELIGWTPSSVAALGAAETEECAWGVR